MVHYTPHLVEGICICGCDECGRHFCWCPDCACDEDGDHAAFWDEDIIETLAVQGELL